MRRGFYPFIARLAGRTLFHAEDVDAEVLRRSLDSRSLDGLLAGRTLPLREFREMFVVHSDYLLNSIILIGDLQ